MDNHILEAYENEKNYEQRIAFLIKLYEKAGERGAQLNAMRQRNLNLAIVIFAAMFTFTIKFSGGLYSIFVSLALLCIMIVFCLFDRRIHKFIHGWRKTRIMFIEKITDAINNSKQDI